MAGYFTRKTSDLVRELLAAYGESGANSLPRFDDVLKFVLAQMDRMPWLLRYAIHTMTLFLGFTSFLHRGLSQQLQAWSRSRLRPCRDFVKFYAAMVVLSLYSDPKASNGEGL